MKRAIMIAALALIPITASAWDNDNRQDTRQDNLYESFYRDQAAVEQAAAMRRIAEAMEKRNQYDENREPTFPRYNQPKR